MIRRLTQLMLMAVLALVAGSGVAHAQSAMNGVVRDTSGAVLPGVTVEASSDALIEKSKVLSRMAKAGTAFPTSDPASTS